VVALVQSGSYLSSMFWYLELVVTDTLLPPDAMVNYCYTYYLLVERPWSVGQYLSIASHASFANALFKRL